ncbi:MAG: RnfABCDGE type electron transport complex subunit A [Candidatus Cloacimonetes bacterium]|nr:RnfABCDGE type electron transport complex subunit A [Candidatus Cloacimonadota bacterium]
MEYIAHILHIAIFAILVNNFILAKFLGLCPYLGVSKKLDSAFGMGMAVIFVMTLASAITYVLNSLVLVPFELQYLQTIAFILTIASIVQAVEIVLQKLTPELYGQLGIFLPLLTTNCAVLGVALLNLEPQNNGQLFDFFESTLSGFFNGIGYALVLLLMAGIRERLDRSDVPDSMKGMPIALVVAGCMALAFIGFSGMRF